VHIPEESFDKKSKQSYPPFQGTLGMFDYLSCSHFCREVERQSDEKYNAEKSSTFDNKSHIEVKYLMNLHICTYIQYLSEQIQIQFFLQTGAR
jgi:hypothetical protein